jgi:septal ring factor EnvC (AmiA/AmiB activator)
MARRFISRSFARLGLITILLFATTLSAQTPADLQKRAADRLAALQKESEALAHQEQTLLVELRKLELDRQIKSEQLARIERDAGDVQARLAETIDRAQTLQRQAAEQAPDIEARLVKLYKMGGAGYWRLLLDVDDIRDVSRAYRTAAALARIDRDRLDEHAETLKALAAERAGFEAHAKDLDRLEAQARDARAAVERAVAARTALVKSIDQRRDLNAQLTGELQVAQQKLQETIAQIAAGAATPATLRLPLRPFQGGLPWPADGVVMRRFGRQPTRDGRMAVSRDGIELSLPDGQPVRAVHDGTVAFADQFTGYGDLVIVDHGDRAYSLYGNLQSVSVKKGDRVQPGTAVGLAGRNPAGNPSLYFELRVDGKPVDPLQWLKRP